MEWKSRIYALLSVFITVLLILGISSDLLAQKAQLVGPLLHVKSKVASQFYASAPFVRIGTVEAAPASDIVCVQLAAGLNRSLTKPSTSSAKAAGSAVLAAVVLIPGHDSLTYMPTIYVNESDEVVIAVPCSATIGSAGAVAGLLDGVRAIGARFAAASRIWRLGALSRMMSVSIMHLDNDAAGSNRFLDPAPEQLLPARTEHLLEAAAVASGLGISASRPHVQVGGAIGSMRAFSMGAQQGKNACVTSGDAAGTDAGPAGGAISEGESEALKPRDNNATQGQGSSPHHNHSPTSSADRGPCNERSTPSPLGWVLPPEAAESAFLHASRGGSAPDDDRALWQWTPFGQGGVTSAEPAHRRRLFRHLLVVPSADARQPLLFVGPGDRSPRGNNESIKEFSAVTSCDECVRAGAQLQSALAAVGMAGSTSVAVGDLDTVSVLNGCDECLMCDECNDEMGSAASAHVGLLRQYERAVHDGARRMLGLPTGTELESSVVAVPEQHRAKNTDGVAPRAARNNAHGGALIRLPTQCAPAGATPALVGLRAGARGGDIGSAMLEGLLEAGSAGDGGAAHSLLGVAGVDAAEPEMPLGMAAWLGDVVESNAATGTLGDGLPLMVALRQAREGKGGKGSSGGTREQFHEQDGVCGVVTTEARPGSFEAACANVLAHGTFMSVVGDPGFKDSRHPSEDVLPAGAAGLAVCRALGFGAGSDASGAAAKSKASSRGNDVSIAVDDLTALEMAGLRAGGRLARLASLWLAADAALAVATDQWTDATREVDQAWEEAARTLDSWADLEQQTNRGISNGAEADALLTLAAWQAEAASIHPGVTHRPAMEAQGYHTMFLPAAIPLALPLVMGLWEALTERGAPSEPTDKEVRKAAKKLNSATSSSTHGDTSSEEQPSNKRGHDGGRRIAIMLVRRKRKSTVAGDARSTLRGSTGELVGDSSSSSTPCQIHGSCVVGWVEPGGQHHYAQAAQDALRLSLAEPAQVHDGEAPSPAAEGEQPSQLAQATETRALPALGVLPAVSHAAMDLWADSVLAADRPVPPQGTQHGSTASEQPNLDSISNGASSGDTEKSRGTATSSAAALDLVQRARVVDADGLLSTYGTLPEGANLGRVMLVAVACKPGSGSETALATVPDDIVGVLCGRTVELPGDVAAMPPHEADDWVAAQEMGADDDDADRDDEEEGAVSEDKLDGAAGGRLSKQEHGSQHRPLDLPAMPVANCRMGNQANALTSPPGLLVTRMAVACGWRRLGVATAMLETVVALCARGASGRDNGKKKFTLMAKVPATADGAFQGTHALAAAFASRRDAQLNGLELPAVESIAGGQAGAVTLRDVLLHAAL